MTFDTYRLPDGTLVQTDATATKGRLVSDFTLAGGQVVPIYLVTAAVEERLPIYTVTDAEADAARLMLVDARGRFERCLILARGMTSAHRARYCQTAREALALAAADVARLDPVLDVIDAERAKVEEAHRG